MRTTAASVGNSLSNNVGGVNSNDDFVYVPLPSSTNLKHLNLKSEVDRRKTHETWRLTFMGANQLAAAGF